jgi:hypothetical protein
MTTSTGGHASNSADINYPLVAPAPANAAFEASSGDTCDEKDSHVPITTWEDCQKAELKLGLNLTIGGTSVAASEDAQLGCRVVNGSVFFIGTEAGTADETAAPGEGAQTALCVAQAVRDKWPVAIGGTPGNPGGNGYVLIRAFMKELTPNEAVLDLPVAGVVPDEPLGVIDISSCATSAPRLGSCADAFDTDTQTAFVPDQVEGSWVAADLGALYQVKEIKLWRPAQVPDPTALPSDEEPEPRVVTWGAFPGKIIIETGTTLEPEGQWAPVAEFVSKPDTEEGETVTDMWESYSKGLETIARYIRVKISAPFKAGFKKAAFNSLRFVGAKIQEKEGWYMFMKQYHEAGWEGLGDAHSGFFGVADWLAEDRGDLSGNVLLGKSLKQDILRAPHIKMVVRKRSSGQVASITWTNEDILSWIHPGDQLRDDSGPLWRKTNAVVDNAGTNQVAELGVCKGYGGFASFWPTQAGLTFLGSSAVQANPEPTGGCDVGPWDSQMLFRPESTGSYNFGAGNSGDFTTADYDFEFWYKEAPPEQVWISPVACEDSGSVQKATSCKAMLSDDFSQILKLEGVEDAWVTFDLGRLRQVSKMHLYKPVDSGADGLYDFVLERGDALDAAEWVPIKSFNSTRALPTDGYELFEGFSCVAQFLRLRVVSNYGAAQSVTLWSVQFDAPALRERGGYLQFMRQHHDGAQMGDLHNGVFGVKNWFDKDLGDPQSNFMVAASLHSQLQIARSFKLRIVRRSTNEAAEIELPNSATTQHLFDSTTHIEGTEGKNWGTEIAGIMQWGKRRAVELSLCKNDQGFTSLAVTGKQLEILGKTSVQPNPEPTADCDWGPWDSQMLLRPSDSGSYNFGDGSTGDMMESDYNLEMWFEPHKETGKWLLPDQCSSNLRRGGGCLDAVDNDPETGFVNTVVGGGWISFDLGETMEVSKIELRKAAQPDTVSEEQGIREFVIESSNALDVGAEWMPVKEFESVLAPEGGVEQFDGFTVVTRFIRIHVKTNYGAEVLKLWGFRCFANELMTSEGGGSRWVRFMKQSQAVGWSKVGNKYSGLLGVADWFQQDIGTTTGNYLFAKALRSRIKKSSHIKMTVTKRDTGKTSALVWRNGDAIQAFMGDAESILKQGGPSGVDKVAVEGEGDSAQVREFGTCRVVQDEQVDRSIYPKEADLEFLGATGIQADAQPGPDCSVGPWNSQMLFKTASQGSYNFGDKDVGGFIGSAYDFEFWLKEPLVTGRWLNSMRACADSGAMQGNCELTYDGHLTTMFVAANAASTWISWDLGSLSAVTKIEIWRALGDGLEGELTLQRGASLTGENWTDVHKVTTLARENAGYETFGDFVLVSRYVRLTLPQTAAVHEISLYADTLPKDIEGFITFMRQQHGGSSLHGDPHNGIFGVLDWLENDDGTPAQHSFVFGKSLKRQILGASEIKMVATQVLTGETAQIVWTNELPHGGAIRGFLHPGNFSTGGEPIGMSLVEGAATIFGKQLATAGEADREMGLCVSRDKFRSMWFTQDQVEWMGKSTTQPTQVPPSAQCDVGPSNSQLSMNPDETGSYAFGDDETGDFVQSGYDFTFSFKPAECTPSNTLGTFVPTVYLARYSDVAALCRDEDPVVCTVNHWETSGRDQERIGCQGCCPGEASTDGVVPPPPPPAPPTPPPTEDVNTYVVAAPVAQWDFTSTSSSNGLAGELKGGAVLSDGKLVLTGKADQFFQSQPLPVPLQAKTIVVLARLSDVDQCCGAVAVISQQGSSVYDGIAIGHGEPRLWEPISEDDVRTEQPAGNKEVEPEWVHLAVVYSTDNKIAVFRNGKPYGAAYSKSIMASFNANAAVFQIGRNPNPASGFSGEVESAAVYDRALSPLEVQALYAQTPAQSACQGTATLYENDVAGRGAGWEAGFKQGTYSYNEFLDHGATIDAVSSLKVPNGCEVILFGGDLTGWTANFPPGDYSSEQIISRGGQNDGTRSLKVVEWGPAQATVVAEKIAREAKLRELESEVVALKESRTVAADVVYEAKDKVTTTEQEKQKHLALESKARADQASHQNAVKYNTEQEAHLKRQFAEDKEKIPPLEEKKVEADALVKTKTEAHERAEQQHAVKKEALALEKSHSADIQNAVAQKTLEEKHAQDVKKRALKAKKRAHHAGLAAEHSESLAEDSVITAQKALNDGDSVVTEMGVMDAKVTTVAQAGLALEAKAKQTVKSVVDEEASLEAELDRRTTEVTNRHNEVKEWEEKVTAWAKKQEEDKTKWEKDIAEATDAIAPLKTARQEKADALTQEETVATGTGNALKEEKKKLSTFFEETLKPLKEQYAAAVEAASKAAAEFERIKAIKPAAEVEVAAAKSALELAQKSAEETATQLQSRQQEAAAALTTETSKVENAQTAYDTGVAAKNEVKGKYDVAKAKEDNQRTEYERALVQAEHETSVLEDERSQVKAAEDNELAAKSAKEIAITQQGKLEQRLKTAEEDLEVARQHVAAAYQEQKEQKEKWTAALSQSEEQKTEFMKLQGETQMQTASLTSAENALTDASKRYKDAVHEQQTSSQAAQDATEKIDALTTQLAMYKSAEALAKEGVREQTEQADKAGTQAQIKKDASNAASSRREEAREHADKLNKQLRDAQRALQAAQERQKIAEEAVPKAEVAVRKSTLELQKAHSARDSVVKAGIPLDNADKNVKNEFSEAKAELVKQQHRTSAATLESINLQQSLRKSTEEEERLRKQYETSQEKLQSLRQKFTELQAEVDKQMKQLKSKRARSAQFEEDVLEKEQVRATAKAELRKARDEASSLHSVKVRAQGKLGGSQSEEESLSSQIERLSVESDRAKDHASQVAKKETQMKGVVAPSLDDLIKARSALKKWNAEKIAKAKKQAQMAAAAVIAEATAQAQEIRNETSAELISLEKQTRDRRNNAKANYEFRMEEASAKADREDDSVAEARAAADRSQDRATRHELKQGEDANRMKRKAQDEADEYKAEAEARTQKRAAGQISLASAEALSMRHRAKKEAKVVVGKGLAIEKAAQNKMFDAQIAAKQMKLLNDQKLKKANQTLAEANDEAAQIEKKAQNEADDALKPVVMKAREHLRQVEKEAKEEVTVFHTEASKKAHAMGEEQLKQEDQAEALKQAAEESELSSSSKSNKLVSDASADADKLKLSSVKAIGDLQREEAGKLEVVKEANKEAITRGKALVADAKEKVATEIAAAKAKCGGEDCLNLIQKDTGTVSVLDNASEVPHPTLGEGAAKGHVPGSAIMPERDEAAEGAEAALRAATQLKNGQPLEDGVLESLPQMPKKRNPAEHEDPAIKKSIREKAQELVDHWTSKHAAKHSDAARKAHQALKSLTVAVSSNNKALAELKQLGNSTETLDTKTLSEAYIKGRANKANSDWRAASNQAVAAEVEAMKSTQSSGSQLSAVQRARKRKVRLDKRISEMSTAVDAAISEFQKANRTEADMEMKVRQATLALQAARQAEHDHIQARDKLAAEFVTNERAESETSKSVSAAEVQVSGNRKRAEEALVKQTELQGEAARASRAKQEAERLLQEVDAEEKRAQTVADAAAAKVEKNADEQRVAERVVANSESGLAVAERLHKAAEAALTDARGTTNRATTEESNAENENAEASQDLEYAKADASKAEQGATTHVQAWELSKQELQQKEHTLQQATSTVETTKKDLGSEKRKLAINSKKKQIAEEAVASTWEEEESSKTTVAAEVEKLEDSTLKENRQAETVEEFTISEQGAKGKANAAKAMAVRAAKAKDDASKEEKLTRDELQATVDSIEGNTQKITQYQQEHTEAQARVTAQMPPQKQAIRTRDNEKTELTELEGETQKLETVLAAKQQGEDLLNEVLQQATTQAAISKRVNDLRVADASAAATAAKQLEESATTRDEKAKVALANAPEPIGSPEEAAEAETAEEEQRLHTEKKSKEEKEDEMEEEVASARQVHAQAEGKVKEVSQVLDTATTAVQSAERTVTELKERAEASAKAGADEAARLDGKVANAKQAVIHSEEKKKHVEAQSEKIKTAITQLKELEGTIAAESSHQVGEKHLQQQQRMEALTRRSTAEDQMAESSTAAETARASAKAAAVYADETSAAAAQTSTELQIALRNLRDARAAAIDSTDRIQQGEEAEKDAAVQLTSASAALTEEQKKTSDANEAFDEAHDDLAESQQKVVDSRMAVEVAKSGIVTAKEVEQSEKENAQQKEDELPGLEQKVGEAKVAYRQLDANVKFAELRVTRFENGQDSDADVSTVNHCVRDDGTTRVIDGC